MCKKPCGPLHYEPLFIDSEFHCPYFSIRIQVVLKYLPQKKSICDLRCASAIQRLLVLSDNQLSVLDSSTLETPTSPTSPSGYRPVKNVTSFCLNENPVSDDPFSIFVCVATHRKKTIQLLS